MSENKTHFGFKQVDTDKKESLVAEVFSSVASKYDIMNDVMSFGIHRIWKKIAMAHTGLKKGMHALDIAGGTGDLTIQMAKQVGATGEVIISDIGGNDERTGFLYDSERVERLGYAFSAKRVGLQGQGQNRVGLVRIHPAPDR